MITKETIISVMQTLSKKRFAFWSEADFQFAFAWELQQKIPAATIRLERCIDLEIKLDGVDPKTQNTKNSYIDIWVELEGRIYPIELKYKTKGTTVIDENNEEITLKNQAANDIGRYFYLWDILRLEHFRQKDNIMFEKGFAILLTNDSLYYKEPNRCYKNRCDAVFRIHEDVGFDINHSISWIGEKKDWQDKYPTFTLSGSYQMKWNDFHLIESQGDLANKFKFKYIITEVN